MDTLGATIAFKIAGMNTRQGMWFFTGSTFKTVDDHCGYALPFDPLQHITSNNAGYHDVHHQSWGIKTNFSQPFFTFWDRILGTKWTGGDVSARYERSRLAAQQALNRENEKPITGSNLFKDKAASQISESRQQIIDDGKYGGPSVLADEAQEEVQARIQTHQSPRKRSTSALSKDGLLGLKDRMPGAGHGRTAGIIGVDGSR